VSRVADLGGERGQRLLIELVPPDVVLDGGAPVTRATGLGGDHRGRGRGLCEATIRLSRSAC
jgi:hypothetical protein